MPALCQCGKKRCHLTRYISLLHMNFEEDPNMFSSINNKCAILEYFKHTLTLSQLPPGDPLPLFKFNGNAGLRSMQDIDTYFRSTNGKTLHQFLCPDTGAGVPDINAATFAFGRKLLTSASNALSRKFLVLRGFAKPTCECSEECEQTIPIVSSGNGPLSHMSQGCILILLALDEGVNVRISQDVRDAFEHLITTYDEKYLDAEDNFATRITLEDPHVIVRLLVQFPEWNQIFDEVLGRDPRKKRKQDGPTLSTSITDDERKFSNSNTRIRFRSTVAYSLPEARMIRNMKD